MSEKLLLDWMPEQASTFAAQVDFINNFITYVAAFCTIAITGAMLWFAFRYREKAARGKTSYITHSATLETVWTAIPTLVCIFVAVYGTLVYHDMRTPPADPLEIVVTGRQWAWHYKYPNGKTSDNDFVVPINKPVRLIMISQDVNHSFFLPSMRVKEDVIAGAYHYLWFTPTKLGTSHVFCTEYCGLAHSSMIGKLHVVTEEEFQDFVNDRSKEELAPDELGRRLYDSKGCKQCHSIDGSAGIGPSLKGIFGKTENFTDGTSGVVDENYIRESILYPNAKIVQGYAPLMPSLDGQISNEEIDGLIAYIKTLK